MGVLALGAASVVAMLAQKPRSITKGVLALGAPTAVGVLAPTATMMAEKGQAEPVGMTGEML